MQEKETSVVLGLVETGLQVQSSSGCLPSRILVASAAVVGHDSPPS